jgi:hypothetical protein
MVMRTYRTRGHWAWFFMRHPISSANLLIWLLAGPALLMALELGAFSADRWGPPVFGFVLASAGTTYAVYLVLDTCYRIDLNHDGSCQFRSLLHRRHLRAEEIISVKTESPTARPTLSTTAAGRFASPLPSISTSSCATSRSSIPPSRLRYERRRLFVRTAWLA